MRSSVETEVCHEKAIHACRSGGLLDRRAGAAPAPAHGLGGHDPGLRRPALGERRRRGGRRRTRSDGLARTPAIARKPSTTRLRQRVIVCSIASDIAGMSSEVFRKVTESWYTRFHVRFCFCRAATTPLLKGLNQRVQQHAIEATVRETDAV